MVRRCPTTLTRPSPLQRPSIEGPRNAQLFQLLRPELVRQSAVPLCSDAYVGMAASDPKMAEHMAEVDEATDHLLEVVVPDFAALLDVIACRDPSFADVSLYSRAFGVNARHLGRVRDACCTPEAKRVVLTEILARTLKNELCVSCRV